MRAAAGAGAGIGAFAAGTLSGRLPERVAAIPESAPGADGDGAGKVEAGTRVDFVRSGAGVAVRAGSSSIMALTADQF